MLVGICGQLLDARQDLCQNGINLVILTKVITELWKEKRRKEERWRRKKGERRGRKEGDGEWRKTREAEGGKEEEMGKGKGGNKKELNTQVRLASSRGILTHSHTNTLSSPYL